VSLLGGLFEEGRKARRSILKNSFGRVAKVRGEGKGTRSRIATKKEGREKHPPLAGKTALKERTRRRGWSRGWTGGDKETLLKKGKIRGREGKAALAFLREATEKFAILAGKERLSLA